MKRKQRGVLAICHHWIRAERIESNFGTSSGNFLAGGKECGVVTGKEELKGNESDCSIS